jgi:pSer/pThr/pTyr-binding forkhead associated (FHA) protein
VSGGSRRTSVAEEGATSALAPTAGTRRVDDAARSARLSYRDEQGEHRFTMRAEVITIGRGGPAHWVDVRVVAGPQVSRQHCRIRRDADGRFFITDLSSWGTSVDGVRVTSDERELPATARIDLADAVTIDFSVEAAPAC